MIDDDDIESCVMHNVNSRIVSLQFTNNRNYNCRLPSPAKVEEIYKVNIPAV